MEQIVKELQQKLEQSKGHDANETNQHNDDVRLLTILHKSVIFALILKYKFVSNFDKKPRKF